MNPPPRNLTGVELGNTQAQLSWNVPITTSTVVFTANGSYTAASAANALDLFVIGGGGGGAGGRQNASGSAPSGGGGAGGGRGYALNINPATFLYPVAVLVGMGGSPSVGGSGLAGSPGNTTSFGSYMSSTGGGGGVNAGGGGHANGGTSSSTITGAVLIAGGNGGEVQASGVNPAVPAPSTSNSPSGGGGGGASNNGGNPPPPGGNGGAVASPSLAGGIGGASFAIGASGAQTLRGGDGTAGASAGFDSGSGGGAGGFALLQDDDLGCQVFGGTGAPGGLYGAGGGGGGGAQGAAGGTQTGGNGGSGAQGLVVVVEHYTTPDSYNVYRNGVLIATGITSLTYIDTHPTGGTDVYDVTAVYSGVESVPSNTVTLVFSTPISGKFVNAKVFVAIEIGRVGDIIPRIWPSKKNNTVYG